MLPARHGLALSWLPALALAACAPSQGQAPVVVLAVATSAPVARVDAPADLADLADIAAECASGAPCEAVGEGEASALAIEIEAAHQAVLDGSYADVPAMVRLAKLQLQRDHDEPDPDGTTDAARALRNAMRAVAVEDTSAEARLVLALALARSLPRTTSSPDPLVRGLALDLVGLTLQPARRGGGTAVRAAAGVLEATLERARDHTRPERSSHLGPEPLAPAPPPPPRCSSGEAAAAASAVYCNGLDRLGRASSRADHEQAAGTILEGWRALAPLCEAHDPACPPHVAFGVAAASRAFQAAGRPAKSIAGAKLVVDRARFPGAAALEPVISLELADRFYALGIFEEAAGWYERAARLLPAAPTAAAARALQIRVALGDEAAATRLAGALAGDGRFPLLERARWVVAVAHVVRAARGPAEAATWIARYQALLHQEALDADAREATAPLPAPDPKATGCTPLACAVGRLARQRW
jgi:hypothetical protein